VSQVTETRELFTLDCQGAVLRGTFHKPRKDFPGTSSTGILSLAGFPMPRAAQAMLQFTGRPRLRTSDIHPSALTCPGQVILPRMFRQSCFGLSIQGAMSELPQRR